MILQPSRAYGYASPASPWWTYARYPDLWRGCVGYWAPILGPTGGTLFDVSGFSRHSTLMNMDPATDWIVGRHGGCLDLDGTNEYLSMPNGGGLNGQTEVSFALWVRWLGTSQDVGVAGYGYGHVTSRQWNGTSSQHLTWLTGANPTTAVIEYKPYAHTGGGVTGSTSPGNEWHSIIVTSKSGDHHLYLDGRTDGTASTTGTFFDNSSIPFSAGAWSGDGDGYSTSQIAEVSTWSRILSPNEARILSQRPGIMLEYEEDIYARVATAAGNRRRRLLLACGD